MRAQRLIITSGRWLGSFALAFCLAASGCTGEQEDLGRVEITLQGQAPDGSIYRLPAGTFLWIDGGRYHDAVNLAADVPMIEFQLPVGTFGWRLRLVGPTPYPTEWELEREDPSGATETLSATLVNPQPESIQIVKDQTTNVVIQFDVLRGGRVTFDKGTVNVTLNVSEDYVLGGALDSITTALTATDVLTYPGAPLGLPALGDAEFSVGVTATVSGDWEMATANSVCAPVVVSILNAGGSAATVQGFADLVVESGGPPDAQDEVCLDTDSQVTINLNRLGMPTTDTFSGTSSSVYFSTALTGELPAPAFDGDTLDLSLLSGTHSGIASAYLWVADYSTGSLVMWYTANFSGDMTLTFTPQQPAP